MGDYITCETVAAVVVHIRRVPESGPNYNGTTIEPLCQPGETYNGWDTQAPLETATCRTCKAEYARLSAATDAHRRPTRRDGRKRR